MEYIEFYHYAKFGFNTLTNSKVTGGEQNLPPSPHVHQSFSAYVEHMLKRFRIIDNDNSNTDTSTPLET